MGDQLDSVVRRFRLRAELTQEALAERSGLSIRTIRGMETGRQRNPQLASVRQLADALSLSAHDREEMIAEALGGARPATTGAAPVPRQLPAAPQWFTGRARELKDLSAFLDTQVDPGSPVVVCAVGGAGGMGKTWLALHWAHQHLDQFPDGQLFVDLHGFDPSASPMSPETAVRGFLHALGVAPVAIPAELDAQVGLYRSLVADKRMLILADNAADATQVVPLLPGSPSCTMLVTSRAWLPGLVTAHGAHPVAMDVLSETEAHALLADRLDAARLAAEPDAVDDLVAYCAGLPLALSVVVGRAQTHPRLPLAALATEVRDTGLSALDEDDPTASLPIVLASSYRALSPERARVLGLVSIAPGPDISLPAAASLTGLPIARTHLLLRSLEQASLLHEDVMGRWRMHDLIRQHAAHQADRTLSEADRDAALRRLVDFCLHTAHAGDRWLDPFRPPIQLSPPVPGCVPYPLPDDPAAMAWFDAEHPCLLAVRRAAVTRGWDDAVWQLAWALNRFHYRQARFHDDVAVTQVGLAAAVRLGDPSTQITIRRLLGLALARKGRRDEGLAHLQQTVALAEQTDDGLQQATTHHAMTGAWGWLGQDRLALEHATHALRLYRLHAPRWEAEALGVVGWYAAQVGEYDRARAHCQAALALHVRHHDQGNEAMTLDSLGFIDHRTGRHAEALDHYRRAVTLLRDRGDIYQLAETLDALGHPHVSLGQREPARVVWQEALELYQAQQRTDDAQRVQRHLDTLGREALA